MTVARLAAIAKWQIAGSRARKGKRSPRMWDGSKIAPMGKNVTLYHRTTSYRAKNIKKSRKWKPNMYSDPYVFFSHGGVTHEEHVRGKSVLSVTLPRTKIHKEFHLGKGITYYMVNKNDVQGIKVKAMQ